ncbi:PLDc N-terminal domain-containing protein [Salegentibacter salegens]|uniref:Phospholipase_D-nuclease N-terminal n=1 Tax=Salegentibacter salegens TaxID=143223 RepID=A0A1M7KL65_9FLAO|nr:PLDc N-terminal domain-containing protein [Salegentibacter salegens]PRX48907.1 phospholipase D-like protein [Salegentibacter salegens]SHM66127.1 Phospholipase_D-nuclease N-terminal [Salegentibacter salegens]
MIRTFIKYRVLVSVIFYILWGSDFITNVLDLNKETSSFINWTTVAILFIFWLFILIDMIKQNLKDKTFWILSMFFVPFFAPVVYLFRRKKLLHLQNNMFRNSN